MPRYSEREWESMRLEVYDAHGERIDTAVTVDTDEGWADCVIVEARGGSFVRLKAGPDGTPLIERRHGRFAVRDRTTGEINPPVAMPKWHRTLTRLTPSPDCRPCPRCKAIAPAIIAATNGREWGYQQRCAECGRAVCCAAYCNDFDTDVELELPAGRNACQNCGWTEPAPACVVEAMRQIEAHVPVTGALWEAHGDQAIEAIFSEGRSALPMVTIDVSDAIYLPLLAAARQWQELTDGILAADAAAHPTIDSTAYTGEPTPTPRCYHCDAPHGTPCRPGCPTRRTS